MNQSTNAVNLTNTSHLTSESNLATSQQNLSNLGRSGTQASSTTNAEAKERAYIEKIKTLKSENKKLIALMKESEKAFY